VDDIGVLITTQAKQFGCRYEEILIKHQSVAAAATTIVWLSSPLNFKKFPA